MRLRRVIAIAQRDLSQEIKGRRGWVLPAVMAGLLLPVSGMPLRVTPPTVERSDFTVSGEVPERVLAIDFVTEVPEEGQLDFRRDPDDKLVVSGSIIPSAIRDTLDDGAPTVSLHTVSRHLPIPSRSLLFALISASTLTGAISASIAGERAHRTLTALLTAAITRNELIAGKALAWGGLGALSSLVAAFVTIALGRLDIGWWILPLPTVPIATVALGLFLVRRASDLIGGTTVTLRVLPALLAGSGLLALLVGQQSPIAGAAIPLGGALMTAGSTWGGNAGPALVATLSTSALTALCLGYTALDLQESPGRSKGQPWPAACLFLTLAALCVWWVPFGSPALWAAAGNATLADQLPIRASVTAGIVGLTLMLFVKAASSRDAASALSWRPAPTRAWAAAVLVGIALIFAAVASDGLAFPQSPLLAQTRLRMSAGMLPLWVGPGWMCIGIVTDELLFRGWLQKLGGPWVSLCVWTLVKTPLDPLYGLCTGGLLSALTIRAKGSVRPAILAHALWAGLSVVMPSVSHPLAVGFCLATAAVLALSIRHAPSAASV
jgi:ABC-type Na+ efflux pump permease subunit